MPQKFQHTIPHFALIPIEHKRYRSIHARSVPDLDVVWIISYRCMYRNGNVIESYDHDHSMMLWRTNILHSEKMLEKSTAPKIDAKQHNNYVNTHKCTNIIQPYTDDRHTNIYK